MHGVDEEAILGDDDVWLSQAGWTVRNSHNFRSDHWIAIKLLLEYPDVLSIEWMRNRYLLMMRSGPARLDGRFERALTFDLIVGTRSIFYWSFRMPFSM